MVPLLPSLDIIRTAAVFLISLNPPLDYEPALARSPQAQQLIDALRKLLSYNAY